MNLTKKHKLYYKEPNSNSARRLDKANMYLYIFIIKEFLNGQADKRYQELNKDVTHWSNYKAIDIYNMPVELQVEMEKITKHKTLEVFYGGTWKPLARIHKFKKETLKTA